MQVKVNKHEPLPPPPPTYDLIGLSENEARLICLLVGSTIVADGRELMGESGKLGPTTIEVLHDCLAPLRDVISHTFCRGKSLHLR